MIKHIFKRLLSIPGLIYGFLKSLSPVNVVTVKSQVVEVQSPIDHNSKERMDEIYSNLDFINEYIDDSRIDFYKNLIEFCSEKGILFSQKRVADVGCGTGHLLKFIGEKYEGTSLTGFEFSLAGLAVAKTVCPQASFCEYDIYQEPAHSFDVIFCTEVIEHLLYPGKALMNCMKMLANDGVLIVTVPDGRKDTFLGHINFWSPESWNVFIESSCEDYKYDAGTILSGHNYAIIKRKSQILREEEPGATA